MTAAPGPGSEPPSQPNDSRHPRWPRRIAIVGSCLLVGGTALSWLGFRLLQKQVIPFFEDNLSDALERPLRLGQLERITPTGVTFSNAILPPTSNNYSWARIEEIDVSFNLFELLFTRKLRPTLTLTRPDVVVRQRHDRQWLIDSPGGQEEEGFIQTELKGILIQRGRVAIGPVSRNVVTQAPDGFSSSGLFVIQDAYFRLLFQGPAEERIIAFKTGGQIQNGTVQLEGEINIDSSDLNIAVRTQRLPLNELNSFFGGSLFIGEDSRVSAQLRAKVRPNEEKPLRVWGECEHVQHLGLYYRIESTDFRYQRICSV